MEEIKNEESKNEDNSQIEKKEENEGENDSNIKTDENDIKNNNPDLNKDKNIFENFSNDNDDLVCEILKDELNQYDMSFKLIIIGDSFVGKSSISVNASKNVFENDYKATIGFEFFTMAYKINMQNIKLQIWDTCGQEEYRSLIQNFYRNASLAILVYSIDRKSSFENLEIWLNEIKTKGNPDVKIFLVGNKVDLADKRVVKTEEGKQFYENYKLNLFIETSAKSGENVSELFKKAALLLYKEHYTYTNMANKLDKQFKIDVDNYEEQNILDKDEEDDGRKNRCCK